MTKKSSGKIDPATLGQWLTLLSSAFGHTGDTRERERVLEEAGAVNQSCLSVQDKADPDTLSALLSDLPALADVYCDRQDYEKAVALWEAAADLTRRYGSEMAKAHSALAFSRARQAMAYEQLHRLEDALVTYQGAADLARGSDRFLPIEAYISYADLLYDQGRWRMPPIRLTMP